MSGTSTIKDDEIDLRELFLALWASHRLVSFCGILGLASSAFYAFFVAVPVYRSSALLLPTQTQIPDQFGAAAALFGKKKGSGSADVDLYKSLLTSRTVVRKLLSSDHANWSDTAKGRIEPLFRILNVDTANPKAMEDVINRLSGSVTVDTKESGEGGILQIEFEAPTAWLAQGIGQKLLEIGQEELRRVRSARTETFLPFLASAVSQAKSEWDSSARILAIFKDRNRSIVLPAQMLELSRLQMELQVREQKYLLARKEYESQILEREKAAPPMMVLDPANLPAHKSKPKRLFLMVLGLFSGLFLSSMFVMFRKALFSTPTQSSQ